MKPLSFFLLVCTLILELVGCAPVKLPATVTTFPTTIGTPPEVAKSPTHRPSPTLRPTPADTLEPVQAMETIQPLLKEPINCTVPCFWGIIPGKTTLDDARNFFGRLGFKPYEGIDRNSPSSGMYFYTISYPSGVNHPSSVTLYASDNLVKDIVLNPDIPEPKVGSPREWIAYSPETLIRRYGEPSSVRFAVSHYGQAGISSNISVDMIMYFDAYDLIVHYSGYNMNLELFCPLTAPFDFVRIWMGHNPPHTPSFETVPLEKATSLTMDQFTQLMLGDQNKACFKLNRDATP